ncbi:hypothetical protein RND81_06G185500 [Saponaria officinalis]|uniref:Uncharacterized protein n=1 Tax=Saponaria officinalis TaxID=3572 RepID=A0AAW1KD27_SAPOF
MAEQPSSGNEEKDMTKSGSFTKFLGSPSRDNSMKKTSSNPLSKLLFRRKSSSSRKGEDNGGEPSSPEVGENEANNEQEKDHGLIEEVKEVVDTVETAFHDLIHRKKKDAPSLEPTTNDAAISIQSKDVSETSKESKHHFLGKVKGEFEKAKEGIKEDYDKAKEEIKAILHKGKSNDHDHDHQEQLLDHTKPDGMISTNDPKKKKSSSSSSSSSSDDEVKAPTLAQRLQEEVVAVISTIDQKKNRKPSQEEAGKVIKEDETENRKPSQEEGKVIKEEGVKKKEDNCMTSLAQGLQNWCSWGSKKED